VFHRSRVSDWLVAFSLANLVFLRCWEELLSPEVTRIYWLKGSVAPIQYVSVMLDVILLGAVFYAVLEGVRKESRTAHRVLVLLGLLVLGSLVNSLRTLVANPGTSLFLRFVEQRAPVIGIVIAIILVAALVFGGVRALLPVYRLLILLSPFLLFTFGQAAYRIANFDPNAVHDGPMAKRLPAKPSGSPRVVWVIFDEWDQELTFPERPSRIQLPELDRLRATGFSASNAIRPNLYTDWSMPALATGIPVQDIHPSSADELTMIPRGSTSSLRWSEQANVFRDARNLGFNTAVVAWAIPYCRVLKNDLTDCWWWSGSNQYNSVGQTLPEMLINRPRSLFENVYRSPFGQSLSTKRHIWVTGNVVAKSLEVARDPSIGLALLHMPVPHPPYFYKASTGKSDFGDQMLTGLPRQNQNGYVDALALTDQIVGKLRRDMEDAGTWDNTTLIFSADHPYRHRVSLDGHPVSMRVPFLVKMAGPASPLRYDTPFSALLTRKLIGAILSGELKTACDLPRWFDAHRGEYPVN
jgi:hypothetical protein